MRIQYTLKVYPAGLGRSVYRTITICGTDTLDQLCMAILNAFDFTVEHLYEFCMDNKMYSEDCYRFNPMEDDLFDEDDAEGTDIALDELGLIEGQKFSLHYDFGDDWMFAIRVMKIEEVKNIASRCCSVQKEALSSTRRPKRTATYLKKGNPYFGRQMEYKLSIPDQFTEKLYVPIQHYMVWSASFLRRIQQGSVRLYISYVMVAMLLVLIWGAM